MKTINKSWVCHLRHFSEFVSNILLSMNVLLKWEAETSLYEFDGRRQKDWQIPN